MTNTALEAVASSSGKNITLIHVYAPTSTDDEDLVKEFYEQLDSTIKEIPSKDFHTIQGDWNAEVGPYAYEQWPGTVGRFEVGETPMKDEKDFLNSHTGRHKMIMVIILFPHKISRRTTWHSPDGVTHNRIDYILAPRRFKPSINGAKSRTFPGTDKNSDHDLAIMTMKLKLKQNLRSHGSRP